MLIPIPISFVGTPHCPLVHSSYLRNEKLLFNQKKKIEPSQKEWGERGSNSRPQDNSDSYETYALTNCATTPGCNLPWLINNVIDFWWGIRSAFLGGAGRQCGISFCSKYKLHKAIREPINTKRAV